MTPLARLAGLLVAFSLLTWAATPYAASAWVLWRHAAAGPAGLSQIVVEGWSPMDAYENKEECEKMAWRLAPSGSIREYKTMPSGAQGEMVTFLHCFPDTVDPRGPKGK